MARPELAGDAPISLQLRLGASGFVRAGEAPHHFTKIAHPAGFHSQFKFRRCLFQQRGRQLEALRIIREHRVVGCDGGLEIVLRVGDFTEIKLRVGRQIVRREILDVVGKFLPCEIVLAAGVVAQGVLIEVSAEIGGNRRTRTVACALLSGAAPGAPGAAGGPVVEPPETFASMLCSRFCMSLSCCESFADARLHVLQIVREALGLLRHGVDARAGIGLHFLHGFLQPRSSRRSAG